MSTDRRKFLKTSLAAAAAVAAGPSLGKAAGQAPVQSDAPVIDTNVDLCCWPFRDLKYGETNALVDKMKQHGVRQAWAGSYDAMLYKNLDSVNQKVAEECHENSQGMLVPFGAVNPAWPDWQEDLRRCDEEYDMPGIKLIPGYHGYTLDEPAFVELLQAAGERDMLVQIAIEMEDERMRHPRVNIPVVDVTPLPESLDEAGDVQVMLVNPFRHVRGERLQLMVNETDVVFETSNLDGTGGLERVIRGEHWYVGSEVPVDRLLMGSHVPFFPLEANLFKFMESDLTEEQEVAIMRGNAQRILPSA